MVTISSAVKGFYGNYANFKGRASISQYWWVQLYLFIVVCVLAGLAFICSGGSQQGFGYWFFMVINYIFCLLNIIPSIALTVRRLHDTSRGGGWYFIGFIPFIGSIWVLILMLLPSTQGDNRFGPQPF